MNKEYVSMGKVLLAGNSKDRKIAMEGITPGAIKNHELNSLEAANDFLNRYLVSLVTEAQYHITSCQTNGVQKKVHDLSASSNLQIGGQGLPN